MAAAARASGYPWSMDIRRHDAHAIRAAAHELTGDPHDFDALLARIGDAGCVLIGESTHGTAQFYAVRAHVTQRLTEEHGFVAVAVEADDAAAARAGRWAAGGADDADPADALAGFTRFPRWPWRNHEVAAFLTWLREHNRDAPRAVGFHGLDHPSLHEPDPALSRVGPQGWNRRERHMAQALDALRTHVARQQDSRQGKVVVWAHNSHVGDARATEQADLGQVTLGQAARDLYGDDAVLVGQSTFTGTVTAAAETRGRAMTMPVAPARADAIEALLHEAGPPNLLLVMAQADAAAAAALRSAPVQRAIGAIYRRASEYVSHYVLADATRQFDALVHLDTTSALAPLEQHEPASRR
jgi:erythromycin esterase-like protein